MVNQGELRPVVFLDPEELFTVSRHAPDKHPGCRHGPNAFLLATSEGKPPDSVPGGARPLKEGEVHIRREGALRHRIIRRYLLRPCRLLAERVQRAGPQPRTSLPKVLIKNPM